MGVEAADIERVAASIEGEVRRTPLVRSGQLSRRCGGRVTLKAECLQLTGSFKIRGALAALAALEPAAREAGVVAASAGNHAQGVALAATRRGTSADLYMPAEAPLAKLAAVRDYGGAVHLIDGGYEQAAREAARFAEREGRTLIPPFDDPAVIAGQGTVGLELAREAPETRLVIVPVGGGALASGIAIAIKAAIPEARVVGVQSDRFPTYAGGAAPPASGPPARGVQTICDGIAVKERGRLTGELIDRWLDDVITVSDDEVAEAMVLLLERSKLVVEGAGATGVAALAAGRVSPAADGETCAILSGGNVDTSRLVECIRLGETAAGRRLVLFTVVPDRPGALAALLATVAELGANVIDVSHLREGVDLHVRETGVRLVLQTRGPEHGEELLDAIAAEGFEPHAEEAVRLTEDASRTRQERR